MTTLPLAFLFFFAGDDAMELLRRTAAAYEALQGFEVKAFLSAKVPGEDVVIVMRQTAVKASGKLLPAEAPLPEIQMDQVGGPPTFLNSAIRSYSDIMM
ncbi:MAG: hypothetical protein FJW20_02845 [Acidimicrobiia bacterium]|nr:hypothetical protein [Acidimicrobiia bacterium]